MPSPGACASGCALCLPGSCEPYLGDASARVRKLICMSPPVRADLQGTLSRLSRKWNLLSRWRVGGRRKLSSPGAHLMILAEAE